MEQVHERIADADQLLNEACEHITDPVLARKMLTYVQMYEAQKNPTPERLQWRVVDVDGLLYEARGQIKDADWLRAFAGYEIHHKVDYGRKLNG